MTIAGSLLRDARQRAGLSQVELARRAGISQSVVSAYESGARQPSVPTLARLIEASGLALELRLGSRRASPPTRQDLRNQRRRIRQIAAAHGITNVRLFGSVARGEEGEDSDIDLLVDVAPGVGLLELGRCQAELESLLGARVDLVPAADLKPAVAEDVLAQASSL